NQMICPRPGLIVPSAARPWGTIGPSTPPAAMEIQDGATGPFCVGAGAGAGAGWVGAAARGCSVVGRAFSVVEGGALLVVLVADDVVVSVGGSSGGTGGAAAVGSGVEVATAVGGETSTSP